MNQAEALKELQSKAIISYAPRKMVLWWNGRLGIFKYTSWNARKRNIFTCYGICDLCGNISLHYHFAVFKEGDGFLKQMCEQQSKK